MDFRNPQAVAKMRADFDRQGAMASLGVTVVEVAPGRVVLEMPFDPRFSQQHGFLHAGILTTALDSACGFAGFTLMEEGAEVLTVEFKTSFLRPAAGVRFRLERRVTKPGRTLVFTEGTATAIAADGQQTEIARMSATMMAVRHLKD